MNRHKGLAWQHIEWPRVKKVVLRLQQRIYRARKRGDLSRVHWLQNLLLKNYEAKLYSVFQVTTLRKKLSTEMEIFVATNDRQKLQLAKNLQIDGRALKRTPMKNQVIDICTICDRAKQALCKLALEPEWEALFESNSYGPRSGRSVHDAVEAIFLSMHSNTVKHVYIAKITESFKRINHNALLQKMQTFSKMEKQIRAWLEAGVLENYSQVEKEPTLPTMSVPLGGIISPLLVTILSCGLEAHLKDLAVKMSFLVSTTDVHAKRRSVGFIVHADTFVIVHWDQEVLYKLVANSKTWLQEFGLDIPIDNSCFKDGRSGFELFGFQCIQINTGKRYRIKITPSRKSRVKVLLQLRKIIQKNKAISSYLLITKLAPVVIGWANYYQYCECSDEFHRMDNLILQKIRAWVFRRHPRQGRMKTKQKYFPSDGVYIFRGKSHKSDWILTGRSEGSVKSYAYVQKRSFCLTSFCNTELSLKKRCEQSFFSYKRTNFLPKMSWVSSKKYVKVKGDLSLFNTDLM